MWPRSGWKAKASSNNRGQARRTTPAVAPRASFAAPMGPSFDHFYLGVHPLNTVLVPHEPTVETDERRSSRAAVLFIGQAFSASLFC